MERRIQFTAIVFAVLVMYLGCVELAISKRAYTQWNLPEGAIFRLGKGTINYGDRAVAFSPDGSILAVTTNIGVWLYDAHTQAELALLGTPTRMGHISPFTSVSFFPDGKMLAMGGFDSTISLWSVSSRQEPATLKRHTGHIRSVSFSPDGKMLASGGGNGDKTVKLWSVSSREEIVTLEGHTGAVYSVSFSPDGEMLASGSGDGTVLLWDLK